MLKRLVTIIALIIPLISFAEEFVAGKDYELINNAEVNPVTNTIAVTEFFSYGCPWCYKIEPTLANWIKQQGKSIQFSRVPVVFNKDWIIYAKAYYTAQLLGLDAKLNPLLFKTIQDKNAPSLKTNQAMIDFFTAQGVDPEMARSAFEHSTTVDMQIGEGNLLMSRYHVNGVPAVVINNQYKTDLQMANGEERLIKILNFLMEKTKKPELKSS